jgi:hypothetical protein
MKRRGHLAAILGVLLLGGCGSGSSDSGRAVEGVVHHWQLAVAHRKAEQACALLDEQGQAMLKRELAGFVAAHVTDSSCQALIGFLHDAVLTASQRTEFAIAKPMAISVAGDEAKARGGGANFWLTRRNGRWLISEIPLATTK